MNYIEMAIEKLNLNGVYFTPKTIKNKIQMQYIKDNISNPPFDIKKANAKKYKVLSPDGFGIEMDANYKTIEEAETALNNFVKRYEYQGYYSTIVSGERVRLLISEIKENCRIIELKK